MTGDRRCVCSHYKNSILRQIEQVAVLDQADKLSGMVPMALDPGDQEVSDVDDHTYETQTQASIYQTGTERIPNRELQGIWMSELDGSLFGSNKTPPKLTCKQSVRTDKNTRKYVPDTLSFCSLTDILMEPLQNHQKVDATLEKIRQVILMEPANISMKKMDCCTDGGCHHIILMIWQLNN